MKSPLVSVIIPMYNDFDIFLPLIKNIEKQTYRDFEVIIIDDNSKDDSVIKLKKRAPHFKLIVNSKNVGGDESINKGIAHAKGEFVIILDTDVRINKMFIKDMLKRIRSDKNIAIVGCEVIEKDKREYMKKHPFAGDRRTILGYVITDLNYYSSINQIEDTFMVGVAIHRKKYMDRPPFDPIYVSYGEDLAICWKVRLLGLKVLIARGIKVEHLGGLSLSKNKKYLFHSEKNRLINIFTYYNTYTLIKISPLLIFSILLNNIIEPKGIFYRFKSYFWILGKPLYLIRKHKKIQTLRKVEEQEIFKYLSYKLYDENLINTKILKYILIYLNKFFYYYCKLINITTKEML